MHSWTARLNTIGAQALTVLMLMAAGNAVSGWLYPLAPQGRITDFRPDNVLTNPSRSLEKMIVGSFDLQADLSSCVNWNVKQYFLWVTVDYATPQRTHTVTIWDRLITAPWLESKLELDDVKAEYPVMDHQGLLSKQQQMNVTVHVEVMPWVGSIRKFTLDSITVDVPAKK